MERRRGGEQGEAARERGGGARGVRHPPQQPQPQPSFRAATLRGCRPPPRDQGTAPLGAGWEEEEGKEEGGECACVLLLNRARLHPPPRPPATPGTC